MKRRKSNSQLDGLVDYLSWSLLVRVSVLSLAFFGGIGLITGLLLVITEQSQNAVALERQFNVMDPTVTAKGTGIDNVIHDYHDHVNASDIKHDQQWRVLMDNWRKYHTVYDERAVWSKADEAAVESKRRVKNPVLFGYFHVIDPHSTTDTALARAMCSIAVAEPEQADQVSGEDWTEMFGVRNAHHKSFFFDRDWTKELDELRETVWAIHDRANQVRFDEYTAMESSSLMVGAKKSHEIVDLSGLDNCCHVIRANLQKAPIVSKQIPPLTVVINTWRREECLLRALKTWRQCKSVSRIVIVSADPSTKDRWRSYSLLKKLLHKKTLHDSRMVDVYLHTSVLGSDKLTDRFKYDPKIMTDVLFPVDDDISYDCAYVTQALRLYAVLNEGRNKNRIALSFGHSTRRMKFEQVRTVMPRIWSQIYEFLDDSEERCDYNCGLLTIGGIIHKEYWLAFHNPKDSRMTHIRNLVDSEVSGEDMALSMLYSSKQNGMPPLTVLEPSKRMIHSVGNCSLSSLMHTDSRRKRRKLGYAIARNLQFTAWNNRTLKKTRLFFNLKYSSSSSKHKW